MELGRFCHHLTGDTFYNTLTHRPVPRDRLEAESMLAGQEAAAIRGRLLTPARTVLEVVPSYECNLRCPQCYVGGRLKRPSGDRVGLSDPVKVGRFVAAHPEVFGERPTIAVVGGEPFLHPEFYTALHAVLPAARFNSTTNGVWDYPVVRPAVALHAHLAFSFDGLPDDHNRVRRSVDRVPDVFAVSYRNLARVRRDYPDIRITVQGNAVHRPYSDEEVATYAYLFMRLGVDKKNIRFATACETPRYKSPAEMGLAARVAKGTRSRPCCDERLMQRLVVYANKVYGSYYRLSEDRPLGTLDDGLDTIVRNYAEQVSAARILNDPVCMTQCSAVGNCWGLCTNQTLGGKGDRPSAVCDRAYKEEFTRLEVERARAATAAPAANPSGGTPPP
jgi:MoaA/NifB/PqqE/SkfB family radical SAM enzyme